MTINSAAAQMLAGAAAAPAFPMPSIAQNAPMKIGLLTVKTGPLAAGGHARRGGHHDIPQGEELHLAGRKVELFVADTGGSPAGAKNKAQELVERDKVNIVLGPFAAFELLATLDYLAQAKMPTLAFAGAEDVTQRKGNAYLTRTSYTSAQCLYPLADYLHKEMKMKTAATIADDFAFGYEQIGGFQRVLEEEGGRVVKKLWSPLNTADYAPYVAQIARLRCGVCRQCRLQPDQVHQAGEGDGHQAAARRRLDHGRRHEHGRLSATRRRTDQHQSVFARHRQRRQQALHRRHAQELRQRRAHRPLRRVLLYRRPW